MILTLAVAGGCGLLDPSPTGEATQQVSVGLTTDKAAYDPADAVAVSFTGLSGAASDWITIAHPGDAATVYSAWAFTGGGSTGSVTFPAPVVADGLYEARAYNDWDGTGSFAIQARSALFTVGQVPATVSTSSSAFASADPIVITYTGLPGTATDWIGISTVGSAPTSFVAWTYTSGSANGQVTMSGVPVGTYVARSHPSDGYDVTAESAQFTVGISPATVSTTEPRYTTTAPIVVNYTGLSTHPKDWIAVAAAGSPLTSYVSYVYTGGQPSGQVQLDALPIGDYEVRAFLDDQFILVGSATFAVGQDPSMMTAQASYLLGDVVTLEFANLPGNELDWVTVSPAGSDPTVYTKWEYVHRQLSGSFAVAGVTPGTWEARAYSNDSYTIIASSTFTVTSTATISTDAATYTTADTVDVSYAGLPGSLKDWICIAPAGSPDTECPTWSYTGGLQMGHALFNGMAAGGYEARAYLDDGWAIAARTTFTVN